MAAAGSSETFVFTTYRILQAAVAYNTALGMLKYVEERV
jgi:hypothetical protein